MDIGHFLCPLLHLRECLPDGDIGSSSLLEQKCGFTVV
jgi:hypothetical protein